MSELINQMKRIEKARVELMGVSTKAIIKSAITGLLLGIILCTSFVMYLHMKFGGI